MDDSILQSPLWHFSHIKYNKYQFSEANKEYLYNNYSSIKPQISRVMSKGNNVECALSNDCNCVDIVILGESINIKDVETITIYDGGASVYEIDRESIQIHNMVHYGDLSELIILPNVLAKQGSKLHISFKPGTVENINKQIDEMKHDRLTDNVYGVVLKYIGATDICLSVMFKPVKVNALISPHCCKIFNVIKGDVSGPEFTMVVPSYMIKSKRLNFAFYKNDNIVPALVKLLVYVNGNITVFTAEELDIYQELTKYKMSKPIKPAILMSRNLLRDSKYALVYSVDLVNAITNVVYVDGVTDYNGRRFNPARPTYDDFMMEVPGDDNTYAYSRIYGCQPGGYLDDVVENDVVLKFCTKPVDGMRLYLRC